MVPRLALSAKDCVRATTALMHHLEDKSSIVKTSAMQALVDLASSHNELIPGTKTLLTTLTETGTAAMRARGRKLLRQLERSHK
jgi:hypothetical protein